MTTVMDIGFLYLKCRFFNLVDGEYQERTALPIMRVPHNIINYVCADNLSKEECLALRKQMFQ